MFSIIKQNINKYLIRTDNNLSGYWVYDTLCHTLFLVLAIISVYYYKERTLAFDNAFYVFKIIHFGDFNIENGRWGSVPTQALPLLALKLGWSLKTIMQLYSFNLLLYHYLFYLIIRYILKDRWSALILCLSLILCYRYTFYYSVSEVHLGFGPTALLLSIASININGWNTFKKILWAITILFCVIYVTYSHMLFVLLIAFAFVWIWLLQKDKRKEPLFYLSAVIGIAWIAYKILSIKEGSYDASKIPSLAIFKEQLPNLKNLPSYKFFIEFREVYYQPLKWIMLAGVIGLLIQRKFLSAISVSLFLIAFSLLILITYYKGESPVVQENYWILCGFIIALPFTEGLLQKLKLRSLVAVVGLVFSFHVYKIWKAHFLYTQRNEYVERITNEIRKNNTRKGIVAERNLDWGKILTDWDLAFESLLLSSIPSPDSATTFFTTNDLTPYDSLLNNPDLFVSVDFAPLWFWTKDLNKNYFNLKPTLYKKLNTSQKEFDYNYFNKDSLEIILPEKIEITKFLTATIPVIIKNKTNRSIPSIGDVEFPTYISYHLKSLEDSTTEIEGKRSFFETDIPAKSTITTGLLVNLPDNRGSYKLKVDIITELKKWWYIDKEVELIVR